MDSEAESSSRNKHHAFVYEAPFKIGTTSMVYGKDLINNVSLLADMVDHIEIVLFHTPEAHNLPGTREIKYLKRIGEDKNITYSVHLPAFLEVASSDTNIQTQSIQLASDIIAHMTPLRPLHHIIHIPYTTPTLTPEPDVYFSTDHAEQFHDWTTLALNSLKVLKDATGQAAEILVENINYSPLFLKPFLKNGLCKLCMDVGHLLLGREKVLDVLKNYLYATREIHLHGVIGWQEHLSLSVLTVEKVSKWVRLLRQSAYNGIVNLEVFTPGDLMTSLNILSDSYSFVSKKT